MCLQVYVVAGGEDNNYEYLSSTEVLYDGGLSWVTGQTLPTVLFAPASVSLADSVLLLGTFYSNLWYITGDDN